MQGGRYAGASPPQIDFERFSPEHVRGVRAPTHVNWEAMEMAIRRSTETGEGQISRFKQDRLIKAVRRQIEETGLACMDVRLRYNYCRARLTLGDFSDYWGWEFRDYESSEAGWGAHLYWSETWLPKWGGGGCDRLLVLGEQGVGDTIFIASVLPEAMIRCAEVIFECDDRLHTLLERSLPGLKCRPERKFEDRREDYGEIDAFIPSFELLRMFRRDRRAFPGLPYLKPDPQRLPEMEKYAERVGIAWTARQGSLDPADLALTHPLSVNYKHFHKDVEQPHVDLWHDIEGIVALTSVLEKLVCVPNTAHHLAAAQGKRVEIIVPENLNPEAPNLTPWDYSTQYNDGKLLWYKNAQVFRNVAEWRRSLAGS